MKFVKMQGCGNDYVYINCFEQDIKNPSELAKKISNRNFGVGSDGLILILPSKIADCKMRMFNWDGSESEMCGNGIRCVGRFYFSKINQKDEITVETLAGLKTLYVKKDKDNNFKEITVNMGKPIFTPNLIPVISNEEIVKNLKLYSIDREFTFTCLSMGNPHAVTFVENLDKFDVKKYGKDLENNPVFPNKANIEFVEIIDKNKLKMRVWERGSGETLACGTGTCASVVASYLNGKSSKNNVEVQLLGGVLKIDWLNEYVYMTGPAQFVFEGSFLDEEYNSHFKY